jgi:methionyl-tRNA formyltransferase
MPTLTPKLSRELGRLQWQEAAQSLHNLIRALVPWPGCTAQCNGLEVKIWRASVSAAPASAPPGTVTAIAAEGIRVACGEGHLMLHEMQPANRRRMSAQAFAQGYRIKPGDRFA